MADISDVARRREIRRRKILENSEARMKKITGNDTQPLSEIDSLPPKSSEAIPAVVPDEPQQDLDLGSSGLNVSSRTCSNAPPPSDRLSIPASCSYGDPRREVISATEPNGSVQQAQSRQIYAFPKKVSDAETRSYGWTKADARRSSSRTQLIIETLQLSSVGFADVRHWLVMLVAICTRLWFSSNSGFVLMKSVFFPFLLLELAIVGYLNWSHKLVQRSTQSLLGAALLLCGIPSSYVSSFMHYQHFAKQIMKDCCIFIFSFIMSHVIFENWVCSDTA